VVQAATCGIETDNKREAAKPQRESALQKQNKTLRKVLLAIAVDRFRYSPEARSSAVTSMADCLTRRGMSVDTDTIRNHLQRAYQELDQDEKRALMGSR
jgi:hypothetical protein